jgi:uncharacterized LabA/DUF88 family protein
VKKAERIYVAVDVSNLWKSCREQYGSNARLDFQILSELIPARLRPLSVSQHLVAYIVTNPKQKHHAFYTALRSYGFTIRERFMKYDKAAGKPTRTDWDVGMTIDAVAQLDSYDTYALVSGDGDFAQLLRFLNARKKRTMVLTFSGSASKKLYEAADDVVVLNEDIVYHLEGL